MPRRVKEAKITSIRERKKLPPGRHWRTLIEGPPRSHIGYDNTTGSHAGGRWLLRQNLGMRPNGTAARFRIITVGLADDIPGEGLPYADAVTKAKSLLESVKPPGSTSHASAPAIDGATLTVRDAVRLYSDSKIAEGKVPDNRATVHILPVLGGYRVAELTRDRLRRWLADLAKSRPQVRPNRGNVQYRPAPSAPIDEEDAKRKRLASANRTLTVLKAVLNFCANEGHIRDRDAWGRALKPFKGVEQSRLRWLSIEEGKRLINAASPEFRPLVQGALNSGARYGELIRLKVADFDPDAGTLFIAKSKSGKQRYVILTPNAAAFFNSHVAGRPGHDLMFKRDGRAWRKSEASRPMEEAVEHARIDRCVFHELRHSYASLCAESGMPLMILAKNLGHRDTRMCERHYAHLSPSHEKQMIHAHAPDFGIIETSNVVPLAGMK